MATADVLSAFTDKYTGEVYFVGGLFEGDAARIRELERLEFVKAHDNEPKPRKTRTRTQRK